ncbi:MAG: hypothetical protein Crog4KO_06660 [Crocinitomicaceae bacterium]
MEALLIINSLLVAVCVYFIRDFHTDFKETAKTVTSLKSKMGELGTKVTTKTEAIEKRLDKLEK